MWQDRWQRLLCAHFTEEGAARGLLRGPGAQGAEGRPILLTDVSSLPKSHVSLAWLHKRLLASPPPPHYTPKAGGGRAKGVPFSGWWAWETGRPT